jgi:hypothetical protein
VSWRITWRSTYPEESLHSVELETFSLRLGERVHPALVPSSQLVSVERVEGVEGVGSPERNEDSPYRQGADWVREGAPRQPISGLLDGTIHQASADQLVVRVPASDLAFLVSNEGTGDVRIPLAEFARLVRIVERKAGVTVKQLAKRALP